MVASPSSLRALALVAMVAIAPAGSASGQSNARVRASENVRGAPNGEILARLEPGATLAVSGRQDRWLQVEMEGWIWERSLQRSSQEGFDFVVSEPQGENLRDAPSGTILGRVGRGTLLQEVERRPGWIRVRRSAWIWSQSVVETSTAEPSEARPAGPAARAPGTVVSSGTRGVALLAAPDGDTLARAVGGTDLEVVSRAGNWVRVRLEGWAWLPRSDTGGAPESAQPQPLTPEDLTREPEAHRGRVVSWDLQFISLERAEKVRTDFFEGEPFLLTRFGGAEGAFVYVALTPERARELQGLVPLERLRVTGRVRTGSSSLTGTPVLDLLTLERLRTPQ